MNTNPAKEFFTDINTKFENNKYIDKDELLDIIKNDKDNNYVPYNLKTEAKLNMLDKFDDKLTEADFVKFLRYQTMGADYINYDYIIRYYNLKTDDNDTIIFTEEFSFDNKIKKRGPIYLEHNKYD